MWPWRRRSSIDKLGLPRRCFISHSYKDADAREQLLALLPKNVEPFIFPPIVMPPEQMVSANLIDAILASDGLIYLEGGHSAESFWVAFERDYALRAKKRVFAFKLPTGKIREDTSPPMDLPVFTCSPSHSEVEMVPITGLLTQRYFDLVDDFYVAIE